MIQTTEEKAVQELIKGRIYRHFKGDYYLVEDVARHCETGEDYVVYRMLYGDGGGYPSYASAAAIILFAIVLTITVINLIVSKKTAPKG